MPYLSCEACFFLSFFLYLTVGACFLLFVFNFIFKIWSLIMLYHLLCFIQPTFFTFSFMKRVDRWRFWYGNQFRIWVKLIMVRIRLIEIERKRDRWKENPRGTHLDNRTFFFYRAQVLMCHYSSWFPSMRKVPILFNVISQCFYYNY